MDVYFTLFRRILLLKLVIQLEQAPVGIQFTSKEKEIFPCTNLNLIDF